MDKKADLSEEALEKEVRLLRNCINKYAVCIVEENTNTAGWHSKKLKEPNNYNFDPVERKLVFGMVQYFDKKRKVDVCTVANNMNVLALPWYGKSWLMKGKDIMEIELEEVWFDSVMTPRRIYNALLSSYEEKMKAIEYKKQRY